MKKENGQRRCGARRQPPAANPLLTSPAILAVIVQLIQVLQVVWIDDGWTCRPVHWPADGLRGQTKGSADKAVLLFHVTAGTTTEDTKRIKRRINDGRRLTQRCIYLLDSFCFDGILPKHWLAVKSWRGGDSGGDAIATWSFARLF